MKKSLDLYRTLASLDRQNDVKRFLRDLCTLSELNAFEERFQVVQLIDEGIPYRKIAEMTGSSTATITRVAHWLRHGEGGYRKVLGRRQEH